MTGARFLSRARRDLCRRYGLVMEVCLGLRWDDDWIDEAAAHPDELAEIAGLTPEQWRHRTDRAFDLFTTGRRYDPGKWSRYVHAVARRMQARAIHAVERETRGAT